MSAPPIPRSRSRCRSPARSWCWPATWRSWLEAFPGVPTYAEVGLAGHGTLNWSALFAPTGTPQEIIDTLYKAFTEAVNDPAIQEAAAKSGTFGFAAESPAATAAWLQEELAKWRRTTAEIKIEMN